MTEPELFPWLRVESESLFHYTDAAGLLGIVQNGVFWASEAAGLNDRAEVRQGWTKINAWLSSKPGTRAIKMLRSIAAEPSQDRTDVFVLSASTRPDDANQWRLYAAGGRGYAVELDPTVRLTALRGKDQKPTQPMPSPIAGLRVAGIRLQDMAETHPWRRVLYNDADIDRALNELVDQIDSLCREADEADYTSPSTADHYDDIQVFADDWLSIVAHLIKQPGFTGENEARVVSSALVGNSHVRYRAARFGIVRYVELGAQPLDHQGLRLLPKEEADVLPLRSVCIGPLLGEEQVATVTGLLKAARFSDVETLQSNVPLR